MPKQPIAIELEAINRDGETQVVHDSCLTVQGYNVYLRAVEASGLALGSRLRHHRSSLRDSRSPEHCAGYPAHRAGTQRLLNNVMSRIQNAIMARGFVTTQILAASYSMQFKLDLVLLSLQSGASVAHACP